jgi:hypothetical protein
MSDSFNGYHVWLGIPPQEQPPHHYRLLGISVFESDRDVIDHAADRQMAHVRTFQSGRHGPLSQQILNELSTARLCLLTADKKAAYDEQLRARLSSAVMAIPIGKAMPVVPRAVPVGSPSPGNSGVLSPGSSSILSAGDSSVLSPGQSGVLSPGSSSVVSADSSSVLSTGRSGVTPQGKSGIMPPGKSGMLPPGKSSVIAPGDSGILQAGKSGAISPGQSAAGKSGLVKAVPVQPLVAKPVASHPVVSARDAAPPEQEVDEVEVLPLDMALADDLSVAAPSIQIRGKRRSFRQGTNWQRPLLMGLSAAVLVTAFVLLYYLAKYLASPEFKKLYDEEFADDPAPTASSTLDPAHKPVAPDTPVPAQP